MSKTTRRALRPMLERVEGRELLSAVVAMASQAPVAPRVSAAMLELRNGRASARQTRATDATPNSAVSASQDVTGSSGGIGAIGAGGSPLIGQGQPTAHELARDTFRAYFNGPLHAGPGRFSDQKKIYYIQGTGGSSFFLHGDMNLGFVVPTDPNAPTTGVVVLQDKNINSAGILALDLTGSQKDVDRFGRPTHFTFASDPNIYSGIFFVSSSSGTLDIQYHGATATVRINGLVYTSGLTNPLKNAPLLQRGGRIYPRG